MIRTPHYRLPFYAGGDIYRASDDLERSTVTDNELDGLALIIGDGVLTGWTVCHVENDGDPATLEIEVSPGIGFIEKIVNKTLSIKRANVLSGVSTNVYMQSNMIPLSGGLKIETESTSSNKPSATYTDITPPATPTGFSVVAADYNLIDLFWDANTETDFDHYEIWRALVFGGPYTLISSPTINGVSPSNPFEDADLIESTHYYYKISAVDKSGNISGFATNDDTTLPNINKPAEASGFIVLASNSTISIYWNASTTTNVKYRITKEELNLDGTVASTYVYDNLTVLYYQLGTSYDPDGALSNNVKYRITLQTKNVAGILSDGLSKEAIPSLLAAPLDPVLNLTTPSGAIVPGAHTIQLNWVASPSPNGSGMGQKREYYIRVVANGVESRPLTSLGTALTKIIASYQDATTFETISLKDNVVYGFRITTLDVQGNESVGLLLKGTTLDTTPPKDPRYLRLTAGDTTILINWKHSIDADVTNYVLNIDVGAGYGPDTTLDYVDHYTITGLTNGVLTRIKLRAKDGAGNISTPGVTNTAIPVIDTTAPATPISLTATGQDKQIKVSWQANTEPDLSYYNVKRVAVAQNLLNSTSLTEITELPNPVAIGTITTINALDDFVVNAFIGLPDISGDVFFMADGVASNQKSTITAFFPATGRVILLAPLTRTPQVGDDVYVKPTDPSLGTLIRNVGTAINVLDTEMLNNQVYAYYVQAVDTHANASDYSAPFLVAPNIGLNDLNSPTNLTATFNIIPVTVTLAWEQVVPSSLRPAVNHNAFNIYRSSQEFSNFELVSSVPGKYVAGIVTSATTNTVTATEFLGLTNLVGMTLIMRSGPAINEQRIITVANPLTGQVTLASALSTSPLPGDTCDVGLMQYTDSNLINGTTYYYIATAVRDNADIVLDTGSIPPSNSILLATVTIAPSTPLGCNITAIENQQRIIDSIQSTIEEETYARLLAHKHTVTPTNTTTVTALATLSTIDVSTLMAFDFTNTSLSNNTDLYYQSLIKDSTGKDITYDALTTYTIHPNVVIYNIPYIGDFQILVNGNKPTIEFSLDENRNVVVFASPLKATDVVTVDGTGMDYYVPAQIDLGYRGFDVLVNNISVIPFVDEALQTLRFSTALQTTDVVLVVIEPMVPDFGTQQGARQVSLNPNIVLNDFTTKNFITYQSTSGLFSTADTVFVLVNGVRTTLTHSIDKVNKTITFDTTLTSANVVSLEILNKEEVQSVLLPERIPGVDASAFKAGTFLKAQLPVISHEGRIGERALPNFQTLTTDNKYIYQGADNTLGTATTPYSIYRFDSGTLLMGTSGGLLKTSGFSAFLEEGGSEQSVIDYTLNPPSGLSFSTVTPDNMVEMTTAAEQSGGRINGSVVINMEVSGVSTPVIEINSPTMIFIDGGTKILITGGEIYIELRGDYRTVAYTYVYDISTKLCTQVPNMYYPRAYASGVLLPNGKVLICGGNYNRWLHFDPVTFGPDWIEVVRDNSDSRTAEIFELIPGIPVSGTWTKTGIMQVERDFHTCNLLDDNQVLVAGGNTGVSSWNGYAYKPPQTIPVTPTKTAELYDITLGTWTATTNLTHTRIGATSKVDTGIVLVSGGGQEGRDIYNPTVPSWTFEGSQSEKTLNSIDSEFGLSSIDSPVKQFLMDSTGLLLLVSHNNVYATKDGEKFLKTKGLEATGVVHRIAQGSNGTLYAATDLGIYEISLAMHDEVTWFQGGLIGFGTTEVFDLQAYSTKMLAATETGIYETIDDGATWTQIKDLENVYNIEQVGTFLFANAGQDFYKSADGGVAWVKIETLSFIDSNSRMVSRAPLDLFFATASGIYVTRDGVSFFLVDFDKNHHTAENNVHMAEVIGSDLLVGYDNALISVGPNFETLQLAEFIGIVPTVLLNDVEIRDGFQYDTTKSRVIFEVKRLVDDVVKVTVDYGTYVLENGPWYRQNPNGAITVYVNGKIKPDAEMSLNSRKGEIALTAPLTKIDAVTASIVGTSLKNEGEFFHSELEDRIEQEKGLPLSLGRDHAGNLLQMGISIEHNFLERGLERNQYYCSQENLVDRSFNSFLVNSEFYIMGRRDFDRFNSTIDYLTQSEQNSIGDQAFLPLTALEVSPNLWVGTENSIFVLKSSTLEIEDILTIEDDNNSIKYLSYFMGDIWAVTKNGLFITQDVGVTFVKNTGNGLPTALYTMSTLNNVVLLGTDDALYYSDDVDNDYATWFKATFVEGITTQALFVTSPCSTIVVGDGVAYAGIGRGVYVSVDGKVWSHVYDFALGTSIFKMTLFSKKLFVGTNQGIYCDNGSARSSNPGFNLQKTDATLVISATLSVNDLFTTATSLYAVGNNGNVYQLVNEIWTYENIPGVTGIQGVIIILGTKKVALANNEVFAE